MLKSVGGLRWAVPALAAGLLLLTLPSSASAALCPRGDLEVKPVTGTRLPPVVVGQFYSAAIEVKGGSPINGYSWQYSDSDLANAAPGLHFALSDRVAKNDTLTISGYTTVHNNNELGLVTLAGGGVDDNPGDGTPGCTWRYEAIVAAAPKNTTSPSILGRTVVGETVICDYGVWFGSEPMENHYSWRVGDRLVGADSDHYQLTVGDNTGPLTCSVTRKNIYGTGEAKSAPLTVHGPPVQDSPAKLTGVSRAGHELTCDEGHWIGDAPIGFTYTWFSKSPDRPVPDIVGTGKVYAVTAADVDHVVWCRVQASNAYETTTAFSDTATITASDPPRNLSSPTIVDQSGNPVGFPNVATSLSCRPGQWAGAPPLTFTFTWLDEQGNVIRSDQRPLGQPSNLAVEPAWVGKRLKCSVLAENADGLDVAVTPLVSIFGQRYLRVSRASIDFGAQPIGTTPKEFVTITNTSTDTSVNISTVPTGPNPDCCDFASVSKLAAGQTDTITVTFLPDAAHDFHATLLIEGDDGSLLELSVSGTGVAATTAPTPVPTPSAPPPAAPVTIKKAASSTEVREGQLVTYTLTVTNNTDGALQDLHVADYMRLAHPTQPRTLDPRDARLGLDTPENCFRALIGIHRETAVPVSTFGVVCKIKLLEPHASRTISFSVRPQFGDAPYTLVDWAFATPAFAGGSGHLSLPPPTPEAAIPEPSGELTSNPVSLDVLPSNQRVDLGSAGVKVRDGKGGVPADCHAPKKDACEIDADVAPVGSGGGRRVFAAGARSLGTLSGRIAGGRRGRLALRLNKRGRAALAKAGTLQVGVRGSVRTRHGKLRPFSTQLILHRG